jgi:hypothetical protein
MALSSIVKTKHDAGVLTLIDATGTPITLDVRFDNGDLSIDGLRNGLRDTATFTSRGKTRSLRRTTPVYPTISFTAMVTDLSETGTGTLLDWITKKTGTPFASRVSTSAARGDVDTSHLKFTMEGTTYGDSADGIIQCKDVDFTLQLSEGEPNTFGITGTVYGDVTDGTNAILTAPVT